jgi:hypothetical protein
MRSFDDSISADLSISVIRILIVEDDPVMQLGLNDLFEDQPQFESVFVNHCQAFFSFHRVWFLVNRLSINRIITT